MWDDVSAEWEAYPLLVMEGAEGDGEAHLYSESRGEAKIQISS